MHQKRIQDILPWVEQPSRYLGTEINHVRKDPASVRLKFLLAFPDLYEIGTSHFGIQILYHMINASPDMLAERVFAPAPDMERRMRAQGIGLSSLESGIPLSGFDIIGFSLLYELNFTNILGMLSLGGMAFRSADRTDRDPLIIAGGPCTSNPEPVADFFDAIVIGDGEAVIPPLTTAYMAWQHSGEKKKTLLERLARIEGVYVPRFYRPRYDIDGGQRLEIVPEAAHIAPEKVRRAIIPELRREDFPDRPIVPFGKPVHDRLRLEIARGCSRGCRFCQAGMIYRPVRERSVSQLLDITDRSLEMTGYEDISLLSLSTGDYSNIIPLMQALMGRCTRDRIAVSFPSIRAGTVGTELMELVKRVRKTGFTVAVEAGSQRMRDVINKNIQEEDIFAVVENAFRLGWQVIKLYFMIGLPGETAADLDAMVHLVRGIQKIKGPNGRKGKINVSVNTFIPKSHTPFQWAPQASLETSKEKIEWLRNALRSTRVQYKWQQPENSLLEGLFARGDRRLSDLLEAAYRKGCRFDGWSDQFRFDLWQDVMAEKGISFDQYNHLGRDMETPLPWAHIDMRIDPAFLRREWQNALDEVLTPDCRNGACTGCGVCDFAAVQPRLASPSEAEGEGAANEPPCPPDTFFKTLEVAYSRRDAARFFGHLELVNIVLRAIRRADIPIAYSQGFHPMPKVSFDDPLPIGMESVEETFRMRVPGHVRPETVMAAMNRQLPRGLRIHACAIEGSRQNNRAQFLDRYEIKLPDQTFDAGRLNAFVQATTLITTKKNKKGKSIAIDLKQVVLDMQLVDAQTLLLALSNQNAKKVRPAMVLSTVFGLSEDDIRGARILKTKEV